MTQHLSIDEIAVMGKRQIPKRKVDRERLDVLEIAPPGRGVAIVTDGHRAG
jgi:hypothetical protein